MSKGAVSNRGPKLHTHTNLIHGVWFSLLTAVGLQVLTLAVKHRSLEQYESTLYTDHETELHPKSQRSLSVHLASAACPWKLSRWHPPQIRNRNEQETQAKSVQHSMCIWCVRWVGCPWKSSCTVWQSETLKRRRFLLIPFLIPFSQKSGNWGCCFEQSLHDLGTKASPNELQKAGQNACVR